MDYNVKHSLWLTLERCCHIFEYRSVEKRKQCEQLTEHIHTVLMYNGSPFSHKADNTNSNNNDNGYYISSSSTTNNGYSARFDNSTRVLLYKICIFIMSIMSGTLCVYFDLSSRIIFFLFKKEGKKRNHHCE